MAQTAVIDGIVTRYELVGEGPPLLMFSPGGFDATIEKWRTQGIYKDIQFLDHLPEHFTCILFDRRETGQSGGRVERVTWRDYVRQAKGLLDHLGLARAHIMGGCMGCSVASAFATELPDSVLGMVLFWPVGGARYRLTGHQRFAEHLGFVQQNGLEAVVTLVKESGKPFGADPRGGPWASVLRHDAAFTEVYVKLDPARYRTLVAGMARTLIDRDTSPGAEPEDLMGLSMPTIIIPGADYSHATSAARYLQECIAHAEYCDLPMPKQTASVINPLVIDFLKRASP